MSAGVEWIVDAGGCLPVRLADVSVLRAACDAVVETLGLRVIGAPQWHRFDGPGGVTGLYLLAESHLCCHTWPEHGTAAFNLFCCRPRPEFDWETLLRGRLGAATVDVRRAVRAVRDEHVPTESLPDEMPFVPPTVSAGAAP